MAKPILVASERGIQTAKHALTLAGWTQKDLIGLVRCSRQPMTKFFKGEPVEQTLFMRICDRLSLDWQEIADLAEPEDVESSVDPVAETVTSSDPIAQIDEIEAIVDQLRQTIVANGPERSGVLNLTNVSQMIGVEDIHMTVKILSTVTGRRREEIRQSLMGHLEKTGPSLDRELRDTIEAGLSPDASEGLSVASHSGFQTYSVQRSLEQDFSDYTLPSRLKTWHNTTLELPPDGTHFIVIFQGTATLQRDNGHQFPLHSMMYACLPGSGAIGGKGSTGLVVTRLNYDGMFSLGGPIEEKGRFGYIDGATTSILVPPVRKGDPCLHALSFPMRRNQTMHTHPTYRIGLILEGYGECETLDGMTDLRPGDVFFIPPNTPHRFCSMGSDLKFCVFHPDSDIGFTQRRHPILNRTLVRGIRAAQLPQIQTHL